MSTLATAIVSAARDAVAERWNVTSFDHLMRLTPQSYHDFLADVWARVEGHHGAMPEATMLRALYHARTVWVGQPLDLREEAV